MGRDDADGRPSSAAAPGLIEGCAGRREFLTGVLAAGLAGALPAAAAASAAPGRPQAGDRLVFFTGEKAGSEIRPEDLAPDGPQIFAWAADPATRAARDESRLNQVILIRLDPASLDEPTRARAADGIVAYSSVCTHAQCPVAGWNREKQVFHCQCHNSEYDPRAGGKVVFGPAPRPLPALPLMLEGGALTVAGPFIGRVGLRPA